MVTNWLHIFIYHIKSNKLFTFLNILGLSIGIAGLIFAILYRNDEEGYNQWNPNRDVVFQTVVNIGENTIWSNVPEPLGELIAKEPEVVSYNYADGWYYDSMVYANDKKGLVGKIFDTQANFFDYFPFPFVQGNPKDAIKDATCTALSEETAIRLFGSPQKAYNKTLRVGKSTYVVRGVYKIKGKSSIAPEMVTNTMKAKLNENKGQWGNFNFNLFLKLRKPSDSVTVAKKLTNLFYVNRTLHWAKEEGVTPEEYVKKHGQNIAYLEALSKGRLKARVESYPEGRGNYQFLMIMTGLSILILILSIVNYVNLATANAIKRAKEVGVRKVLGASKKNIVLQFLFETTLTTLFALLLAMVIVELALPYYNEFLGKELVIYGKQFYLQLLLIFFITVAVAGIFPALYVSNFETLKVLRGNFSRSKSGIWLRNTMLILQFAIAGFFIVGSYIVYSQVKYLMEKDIGFKGEQVMIVSYRNAYDWREEGIKEKLFNRFMTIKQELEKINGVDKVSTGAFSFGNGANSSSSFVYKDITIQGQNMGIDFEMLDLMNIKMKSGRQLSAQLASDTVSTMLVNETAAKMMKEPNPVGKFIDWNDNKLKVVGVVKDFNLFSPQGEIPPMAFFHFKTIDWMIFNVNKIYIRVKPENREQTISSIEKFWTTKVDTEYPFKYDFVDKHYARTYENYVNQKNLFSLLNAVVILIALFGLFALASFSIQRRMKEIAIRKTLGAETNLLLKDLSKQYVVFCLIGFSLSLYPVYYFLNKWLENFVFRIDISPLPFVIGFAVLLLLTLVVVLTRAYQATRVDILNYLKYE